jgi:hypothetical protein
MDRTIGGIRVHGRGSGMAERRLFIRIHQTNRLSRSTYTLSVEPCVYGRPSEVVEDAVPARCRERDAKSMAGM